MMPRLKNHGNGYKSTTNSREGGRIGVRTRALTVKERILLHLYEHRGTPEDYVASPAITQKGIARAVGIHLKHVSQYVCPLISQELVAVSKAHVPGSQQRCKVYFLTSRGRSTIRPLRSSLMNEEIPFWRRDGKVLQTTLFRVHREERRGTSLLDLLAELESAGHISEVVEPAPLGLVDFSQEAPPVEQFYGREEELQLVTRALEQHPLVVVTGIAGIGKTTLGSKICEEFRGKRSLHWRRVRRWDTAFGLAFRLAEFLRVLGRPGLRGYLGSSGRKDLSRVEEILASDLPDAKALLVLDDVHTASEECQAFLSILLSVLRQHQETSVLLLSRTIPGFYSRRDVELEGKVVEFSLGGLDEESSRALLTDEGIAEPQASEFARASGGSPLFLKILARAGSGQPSEGRLGLLEAYITEEIESSLNEEERRCLQAASLYEVPVPSRGLLLEERGGTHTLFSLRRKGLLEQLETGNWVAHDLLRAYFQKAMASERRIALVSKAVHWLRKEAEKAVRDGNPGDAIPLLENAILIEIDPSRTVPTLQRLGELAESAGDWVRAANAYREASGAATEPAKRARLQEKVAEALQLQGRLREAECEIERGLALLPPNPSIEGAWLLRRRAIIAWNRGDFDGMAGDVDCVTEWMANLPPNLRLQGHLAFLRAGLHRRHPGRLDLALARVEYQRALKVAESLGDTNLLAGALLGLARIAFETGKTREALKHIDKAIALAEEVGEISAHSYLLREKAWYTLESLVDYSTAEALYQEAYRLAEKTHDRLLLVDFHAHFADLYWHQSRYEEAREALERFLNMKATIEYSVPERIHNLGWMVRLCVVCGDATSAERYLQEAEDLSQASPLIEQGHVIEWAKAALQTYLGKTSEAEASYGRAFDRLPASRSGMINGDFLLDYGRFLATMGKTEEAEQLFLKARQESEKLGRGPLGPSKRGCSSFLESIHAA